MNTNPCFRVSLLALPSDTTSRIANARLPMSATYSRNGSGRVRAAVMTAHAADTNMSERMKMLVGEFEPLTKPIDRVRKLLDYGSRLDPLEERAKCPCSRVHGCTTQVWMHAGLDGHGRVRFRADSDSEITKGFIWCLLWLLDGAEPEEVENVRPEDLGAVNVGLYGGKAHSRVNTWLNILASMQERAKSVGNSGNSSLCYCYPPITSTSLSRSRI